MAKQPMNKQQYDGSEYRNHINEEITTSPEPITTEAVIDPKRIILENVKENNNIKVQVINTSNHVLPKYETKNSAGLDLRANLENPVVLPAHGRMMIHTGQYWAIPEGYECQIRPRSGLALKHGITVLNTPGTIDAKVA